MSSRKVLNSIMTILMVLSLLFNGTVGVIQVSAQQEPKTIVAGGTSSMPMDPTDETKVPHYFGPWPNWANSPFTLPNAAVEIQGDGSGATAVAQVNPVNQGIDSIQITSPGSGYTYANVVISGGNNDATATATVNTSGAVISVGVDAAGGGYITPQVSFTGGALGAPMQVGNTLLDRAFATDVAPAVPAFVIVPTPLPVGFLMDFVLRNQAAPAGTPSAGQSFNAYVLRATGVPNEYLVVFDSGTLTVPALADPNISEMATFPVGSVAVQAGDVIAFYGAGIPYDSGAGADLYAFPAPAQPVQGGTVTFPGAVEARTYSLAANVVDTTGFTPATAIAYGGVDAVTMVSGGSGYTLPTVEFDLPDAPDGIQAKGHVAATALGDPFDGMVGGSILSNGIIVDEPGSGYLTAPGIAIHDGTLFDPQVGATLAIASTTLKVTSVALDTFGSGYTSTPTVNFSDATGTGSGAAATAFIDVGSVNSITVANPGSGYLTVGMRKFIDDLPGLCVPPSCPSYLTNPTAKYIPLAVPEAKDYNGIEADEYVIAVVQYRTSFSSDLPPTLVRGYVQLETPANAGISQHYPLRNELLDGTFVDTGYLAVTPPQWLGPVIVATKNKPVRIVFHNLLPNGANGNLFLPVDASMMGSGMGPMDMMMPPMDEGSVMDMVRNPVCTDDPQAKHGMMDLCFKQNRATLHLHGGITPWISDGTAHQWITPAGEMATWPQGVSVSEVPDMNVCAANDDGCMTFYYTNQQSARLLFYHDHSWGITRLNVYAGEAAGYLITDETEQALVTSGTIPADQIPLIVQDRTFVPDAAQLALQDPTWDVAKWGSKGSFWYHHVYMPAQNPGDPGGMSAYGRWMYGPWFWPPAADTKYGPIDNPYYDPTCNIDDPATWQYDTDPFCEPQQIPGTPLISAGMEQFNDTPIVNGVAYPKITLEPKSYRLRILNAANDRFYNFQWYVADPTQGNGLTEVALNPDELAAAQTDPVVFPTPVHNASTAGPDWIQIGTEGGFLPAPVVIDGQQHTTWIGDPTVFNVGNVDQHSLLLAPAERADVIVDFSKFAGKTLILYNDAPAAFPARIPSYDYYTGAPDLSPVGAPTILPGYGPNTRTIMQVTISGTPAPAFNLTKLQNAFRHNASGTGVFESGQHPIIVGQAAYNSAYGTSFAASSNCNAPGSTQQRCDGFLRVSDTATFGFNTLRTPTIKTTLHVEPKAIHDETNSTTFDEFGRMQANLGIEAQPPTPGLQNVTLYPFVNPGTEIIDATNLPRADVIYDANGLPVDDVKITPLGDAGDGTQIWRITHNGVDTHPIHFHLYDVQLVNRVSWDNIIAAPEANELGWKDTVRIAPLEDTTVALRPIIPEVPWELPNAIRMLNPMMPEGSEEMFNNFDVQGNPTDPIINQLVNFGWEYVYHCHILSHEEMDMMRPVSIALPPIKPDGLDFSINGSDLTLTWNDNSITETSFIVQRATIPNNWVNIAEIASPLDQPNTHGLRSYVDTILPDTPYDYRLVAVNTVGYGGQFPSMSVQSISNTLHVGPVMPPSVVSILRASPNPSSAPSVNFTVNFSQPVTGVDVADFSPLPSGTINGSSVSAVSGSGTTYTVSVSTGAGAGTLGLALIDNDTILDEVDPTMPLGGVGLLNGDFTASQIYTIDYTPPAVVSSVRLNANPTSLTTVNFKATFSESVVGVDSTDFTLSTTGTIAGASITSVTGTGATRTVRINTGTGTGTIRLDVVDNDTIKDVLFVPLGGTGAGNGNFTTGQVYSVDRLPPSVASITRLDPNPANNGAVNFRVTFSESVTGVDLTDFSLTPTGTLASPSLTSVTGTGATYTVAVDTGPGVGTLRLDLIDNDSIKDGMNYRLGGLGIGNGSFTTGEVYDVNPPPAVVSIVRALPNPTNAVSVDYTVTFSEAVTGVDVTDFALTATGGITGASVTSVTGTGTTYTVAADTGTGNGTLRLDLMDDDSIIDDSSLPMGGAGVQNYLAGEVYDIDKTPPTVVSIVRALPNPTNAASVDYTVTFSTSVTGVDVTDFALTATGGITGASVTSVTGTGTTYTVAANTGSGDGTLRLDLMDDNSIINAAGSPLGGAGVENFLTGEVYDIDKTVPNVVSIARASANPTGAASVDFTVTFSEPVTGVDTTDFALTATGGITGASVTSVTGTGATRSVVVDTGTGNGTLRLDLMDDNSIVDATSNTLGGAGIDNFLTGEVYDIDHTPPTVVSIVRASVNPSNAASVDYTVTFSEPVTGVDTTDFALTLTGVTGASITSVTGTGTTYTVALNTGSGDGTLRLDLMDDNSIIDSFSLPLGGAGAQNFTTGEVYDIDKTVPTVVSIMRSSPTPTNAGSVTYTVTFSEPVTGVDAADFALTLTGVTGASVTSVTGTGSTRTVAVNTGTGDGALRLDLMDDNSIIDAASNPLGGIGVENFLIGEVYDIDKTAPTVVSIVRASLNPSNAASVDYTVTFSEPVTGVDATDFGFTLTGITGASVTSVTGTGATRTVVVNTGSGDGTLRLDLMDDNTIIDVATNSLGGAGIDNFLTGEVYDIDKTAPTVASIVRASLHPSNAASVDFTVTFSEPVTGVDAADFGFTLTGITGASVTSVTGTGSTRTVAVNTGAGDGTLRLDLMDDNSIIDAVSNPLGGAGIDNFLTGEVYDIDKTTPTVVSIVRALPNPTNAASVDFTVTFSESVSGVNTADFALTVTGGITGASVTSITGTGTTRTVAVNTGSGDGTLRLDLMDDNSIIDAASNLLGGAGAQNFLTGEIYDIDKTVPTIVSIVRASVNPSNAASADFTVTFSEPVTGVDIADFALTATGGITGASVTSVTGTGTTRTVAVNTGAGDGTLRLDLMDDNSIIDAASNSLGGAGVQNFLSGEIYDIDKTAPTVVSIVRASLNPSNAASVDFTVTFSEPVTGVDIADFSITATGGITGASVTSVTGTGATRTVAVNTGAGDGTLRLDLADDNSIIDAASNSLGGAGVQNFLSGEVYDIDKTAPTVVSIVRALPSPTDAASVDFTVTFSEPVTGVDIADFAITATGTIAGASVISVTGTGATRTVVVDTGTGTGTLRLDVPVGANIADLAGNPAGSLPFTSGEIYKIIIIVGTGTYEDTHAAWEYSNGWTTYNGTGPTNNTSHYTSTIGNFAEITFTGTRFILTYAKHPSYGLIDVFVDGIKIGTIDSYNPTLVWRATWMSPYFTAGTHTVRFEHAGAAGKFIDLDRIEILNTPPPAPVGAGIYEDTENNWIYSAGWTAYTGTGPSNNSSHYTGAVGNSAEITFNGTRFILMYAKHPNYGLIDVYVDGVKINTINTYSSAMVWRATWTSPYFTAGAHTVRFVHAGAAGKFIDLDRIEILNTPPPAPVGAGTYDDAHGSWIYSAGWLTYFGNGPLNNTSHYTRTVGDTAEFTFTGTNFTLTYVKYPTYGLIDVYVDGVKVGTINSYNATLVWQATWTPSTSFAAGTHTVQLVHVGGGTYIDIDAITIIP